MTKESSTGVSFYPFQEREAAERHASILNEPGFPRSDDEGTYVSVSTRYGWFVRDENGNIFDENGKVTGTIKHMDDATRSRFEEEYPELLS